MTELPAKDIPSGGTSVEGLNDRHSVDEINDGAGARKNRYTTPTLVKLGRLDEKDARFRAFHR